MNRMGLFERDRKMSKTKKLTEKEAYSLYDDLLNELYPLEGISCNPFSILLQSGDNCVYEVGFNDFCDSENIETVD